LTDEVNMVQISSDYEIQSRYLTWSITNEFCHQGLCKILLD